MAWGDLAAREAGPYGVVPAEPGTEGDDDAADPSNRQGLPGTSLAEYQPWNELSEAPPASPMSAMGHNRTFSRLALDVRS